MTNPTKPPKKVGPKVRVVLGSMAKLLPSPLKMKPVKAWAIFNPAYPTCPRVFPGEPKRWIVQRVNAQAGERIAHVLITEVPR